MMSFDELYARTYQFFFKLAIPFLPYRQPEQLKNGKELLGLLNNKRIHSILIVTDEGIVKAGIYEKISKTLIDGGIKVVCYDQTIPNPTIANVLAACKLYQNNGCEAIIGLGGGSSVDCAKAVGAKIVRPNKAIQKMKGVLKILKPLPLLIAIPTTAGTGSETTLAAVITDEKTHFKYPINDFVLIPHYALLDPELTLTMPKHITSTTGMDALTHAVEAYIGQSTTAITRSQALKATELIYENIKIAYNEPDNIVTRENMLTAAYLAGCAFTVSYVGYIHAIAHSLGGKYQIPHGLANAVIMPYVLKGYGECIYPQLKDLAIAAKVANKDDSAKDAALKFISSIEELNAAMAIPQQLSGINEDDIKDLALNAAKEANPLYPVPRFMKAQELEKFYREVMEK